MKAVLSKIACLILFFIHTIIVSAQVAAVKFTVHTPVNSAQDKPVYLAGSFNYWHEKDSLYKMNRVAQGIYTITIPVFEAKNYSYKYTQGSWNSVEVALNDSNISNRQFVSANGINITDTVRKWKQPAIAADSSEQLKRLSFMKDSVIAKLKPELEEIQGFLKLHIQNMLKASPDKDERKRLDEKTIQHIGNVYMGITGLLWNICNSLSPEQKEQVLKSLNQPANGDFINSFLGAVNNAVK